MILQDLNRKELKIIECITELYGALKSLRDTAKDETQRQIVDSLLDSCQYLYDFVSERHYS